MKKQLKDVCEGFTKNIAQKDLSENNGKYPIFGASGIIKTIDFYISDKPYIGIVKDGSGVGRTNKYPAKSSLLGTMQYILPNQGIDLDYLMYGIRSLHLGENYSGAAIPHIYFKVYKNRTLDFPELAEQKQRSIVLNKIQDAINVKEKQLFELENIIQSEFVEMFGENPVESGKWKVEKIASVVDKNILSVKKKFQKTDTIKYVDISAIDNISNVVTGFTEYVLLEAPSRAQQVINQNDILISTVRPNLRNIAINPFNDNFMVGSSGFCVLRVNDLCNAKYLFYCVLNDDFTNAMVDLTTGAAYPAIKDSDILAYPIALPPLDLQNQFAAFVQQIDKSKFVVKQQIADLQELLDSKMQEYFS